MPGLEHAAAQALADDLISSSRPGDEARSISTEMEIVVGAEVLIAKSLARQGLTADPQTVVRLRRAMSIPISDRMKALPGAHELLAEQKDLPWEKIYIFFGDERHVPPDDKESNYRAARESLLSKAPIPPENIHRIRAELPADVAAQQYEEELRKFFQRPPGEWPRIDLIMLGMGPVGHLPELVLEFVTGLFRFEVLGNALLDAIELGGLGRINPGDFEDRQTITEAGRLRAGFWRCAEYRLHEIGRRPNSRQGKQDLRVTMPAPFILRRRQFLQQACHVSRRRLLLLLQQAQAREQ